jgi:hypothetical protein
MSGELIAFGLGCMHAEKRFLSQILTAVFAILICSSAEAGFLSGLISDACSDDNYKVGQVLTVTIKLGKIEVNSQIYELGEYGYIPYMNGGGYEIKDSSWNKHKLIVGGLPITQIKNFYNQTDGSSDLDIVVKVSDLDGHLKTPADYCGVITNFESFEAESAKKMAQLEAVKNARNDEKRIKDNAESNAKSIAYEQCVIGLDYISAASGSTKELKEWRSRCEETVRSLAACRT